MTLKNSKVNLRQGPSFKYPIKLIYKKKYLPVKILDKSETWRKVRDLEINQEVYLTIMTQYELAKMNELILKFAKLFARPSLLFQVVFLSGKRISGSNRALTNNGLE